MNYPNELAINQKLSRVLLRQGSAHLLVPFLIMWHSTVTPFVYRAQSTLLVWVVDVSSLNSLSILACLGVMKDELPLNGSGTCREAATLSSVTLSARHTRSGVKLLSTFGLRLLEILQMIEHALACGVSDKEAVAILHCCLGVLAPGRLQTGTQRSSISAPTQQ